MALIELHDLSKSFGEGENTCWALKNINLSLDKGDFIAIIGQSGSGKSTLMNILGCLDIPTEGSYCIDGVNIGDLYGDELAALRGEKFGFIFQRYNLLNSMSALDNVALPAVYAGLPLQKREERAEVLLTSLGIPEKLDNRPNELSGGQQQRVSIARALMNGGEIILADEPTGALDSKSGEQVLEILMNLNKAGHTIIMVTHDHGIAAYANRAIELKDGLVISDERKKPFTPPRQNISGASQKTSLFYYKDQFLEALNMSVQAIFAHKMRSMLTMLGIIIGIASVVSMVALGQGSTEKILENINQMGTNTINIMPGTGFGDRRAGRIRTLTVADSVALAQQSYIDSATPVANASGNITWRNLDLTARLNGVGEQYFDVNGLEIEIGRGLSPDDVLHSATVVLLDHNSRAKLFPGGENPLGSIILFNRQPLEIVGVTKAPQNPGQPDTLNLYAPYSTVMTRITGNRHIASITVKVNNTVSSAVAEKNLTELLTIRHGVKDFFTINMDSIRQTIESTTATMTLLISCIAFISLIVGGIGVMNIMLVSVTERTREIGVRMAIGAKQHNVLQQFLIEAVLICIIGGALGILLSGLIGIIFDYFVKDFAMSYSMSSVALALGFSTLIGLIFGYMPARNASLLNPVDALARE